MEHQSTMIEIEFTILNHFVSVLVDLWASLRYISPQFIEKCKLKTKKLKNAWKVNLTTCTERKLNRDIK